MYFQTIIQLQITSRLLAAQQEAPKYFPMPDEIDTSQMKWLCPEIHFLLIIITTTLSKKWITCQIDNWV